MEYVGILTQQSRNNFRSVLLLCLFPCLVVGLVYLFCYLYVWFSLSGRGYPAAELFPYAPTPIIISSIGHRTPSAAWLSGSSSPISPTSR